MSVLDELREEINSHGPYERADQPDWNTVKSILDVIDDFEAAHPGIEDHTIRCKTARCLSVTHWGGHGWKTGRGRWNVQWWLCPACAKAGKVTP